MIPAADVALIGLVSTVTLAVIAGSFKLVASVIKPKNGGGKQDHGPCNVAVDGLADAIREDTRERRSQHREEMRATAEFREAFLRYIHHEEGRRDALRDTGEHPITPG